MGNKVSFTVIEVGPVAQVMAQVDFFSRPETGFGLLIKFPDVVVSDGKEYKAVFVLPQDRFVR
jgi:hypothetical protein